MLFFRALFRGPVSHQIQRFTSHLSSLCGQYNHAPRGAPWARIGPPTRAPAHYVPALDGTDPQEPEFRAAAFSSYHWLSVYTPAGPGKAHASRYWRARAPPSRPWPGWSARPARRFPRCHRPALRCVTCRTLTSVLLQLRSASFCRFLASGQSPSCTALKILPRSRRTRSSWRRQST